MRERDRERIEHIMAAATRASELVAGKDRSALDSDDVLALALTRLLEILGEAARAVTPATREQHPDIPWAEMAATRDRLIHGYFSVDLDIVWQIAHEDLPPLIDDLRKIVAE